MRIFLSLVLLLGLAGCASSSEPETTPMTSAGAEPQASETMDPMDSMEQMDPMDPMESEPAETSAATATKSPSPSASPTASPTQTATASPSPTQTSPALTLAEVAKRNTQAECWVAIDGNVYDLTEWIRQHRGGSGAIRSLCGTDGTSQFLSQHGGESRPSSTLDRYYLGPLAG